jgi:hypothetical protein
LRLRRFCVASATFFAVLGCLAGQQLLPIAPAPGGARPASLKEKVCSPSRLSTDDSLTARQKACYFGEHLLSPGTVMHAALSAGFGEMSGTPEVSPDGMGELGRRVGIFYSRAAARQAGQLLGGLLYHEDPRPHFSKEQTLWGRARSALLSVLVVQDGNGASRPALGPIAGAFGSGFVGMASYRHHNSWGDGFRFAGWSYTGYFTSALEHEFRPDMTAFAQRFLHRRNNTEPQP